MTFLHPRSRQLPRGAMLLAVLLALGFRTAPAGATPPDAHLRAFGSNDYGQLGLGPVAGQLQAATVLPAEVRAVSAHFQHAMLLRRDGSLWGMGDNQSGQLGLGHLENQFSPAQIAADGVVGASAGYQHSLFVKADGSLWGMGANAWGELGLGDRSNRAAPVCIMASGVKATAAGYMHSLVLKTDGSLWGMGYNAAAQLGVGDATERLTPTRILASGVAAIAAGYNCSLVLKDDGTLWAMGSNYCGMLGLGSAKNLYAPTPVTDAGDDIVEISAGLLHTLFRKTDGSLWGMGYNNYGQLGANAEFEQTTPIRIVAAGIRTAAAGGYHTIYAQTDGTLWALGFNDHGQLGDGTAVSRRNPVRIAANEGILAVAAGKFCSYAVSAAPEFEPPPTGRGVLPGASATLEVAVRGDELSYQWYQGASGDTAQPVEGASAPSFTTPPLQSSASYWVRVTNPHGVADSPSLPVTIHTVPNIEPLPAQLAVGFARRADLRVVASGAGLTYRWYEGEAGDTSRPVEAGVGSRLITRPLVASTSFWVRVSSLAGSVDSSAAAVAVEPSLDAHPVVAGKNNYGELGAGAGTTLTTPAHLPLPAVVSCSIGSNHSLFVKADGSLWGLGRTQRGELGFRSLVNQTEPVLCAASGVVAAVASNEHSLFLKADGSLWGMGSNRSGELGLGPVEGSYAPVLIVASGVVEAAAGNGHTLFLMADGSLWGMGRNYAGQLGTGPGEGLPGLAEPTHRTRPVRLVDHGVTAMCAGDTYSMFVRDDGTLWGMGANSRGQLGNGGTVRQFRPAQSLASSVVRVSSGMEHTLYVTSDGSLWGMGSNRYGQAGTGNTSLATPVLILAQGSVVEAAAGADFSLFLKRDGSLWGMGLNTSAELGAGNTAEHRLPFPIVASGITALAAGPGHSLRLSAAPLILQQPQPATVVVDQAASMAVQTCGAALQYQWYVGATGDTSQPVEGATASSFTSDALAEPASFWVRVSNAYGRADSLAATVAVQTRLQAWRQANFGTVSNAGEAADSADPDADGLSNILEYAVASDPRLPTAAAVRAEMIEDADGRHLTLAFNRVGDPTLIFEVEANDGLAPAGWSPIWSSTGSANLDGPVVVTDPTAISSTTRRFLRLSVRSAD